MNAEKFYENGLEFECQKCGQCCKTHEENAYVYLSGADVDAISDYLGKKRINFLNDHCLNDKNGCVHLSMTKGDCNFLDKNGVCQIYPVRPMQCKTWPFWTENLSEEEWNDPIRKCCPGIGKGKLYTKQEIEQTAKKRDDWYK